MRVYFASKLYMAEAWREMRYQLTDVKVVSSWIDVPDILKLDTAGNAKVLEAGWARNLRDVQMADCVICYGAAEDNLVGALIECGMALGMGKVVICVGSAKGFGTWVHHENVYRASSIGAAIELGRNLLA